MMRHTLLTVLIFLISFKSFSQNSKDSLPQSVTINDCIQYALKHYPIIQQALINEKITEENIKIRLADWYPQLNLNANYQNNIQLPTSSFGGSFVNTGTHNVSGLN